MLKISHSHGKNVIVSVKKKLPINHVISKTVLHLVAVCITGQQHAESLQNFKI